jgi:cyclophilin family peptidyl-prolyl cis-trans isomerase/HEAT repeat protein
VLEPDQDLLTVFLRRVDDEDPRVAYEAVQALTDPARRKRPGTTPDERSPFGAPEVFDALVRLLKSPDVHLRAAAVQGLSRFVDREYAVLQFLYDALASEDPEVKAAAVEGLARLLRENAAGILRAEMKSPQWPVRASIAAGLRHIGTDNAIPLAGRLCEDEDVRVVQASLIALRDFPGQRDALDFTLRGLKRPEFGTREVAAETLAKIGDTSVLPALTRAYVESPGLPFTEARRAIVVAALAVGRDSPDLADLLQKAATDASPGIRGLATGRLATGSPVDSSAGSEGRVTPLPGKDFEVAFLKAKPRVEIVTRRGRFVVELLCEEAPIHCFNFLEIAKTGSYAGRVFHRVVPNFVVQGGDEKGDGSGATAYHGGRLRDEANPVGFLDGTLGMPKSDEKDSGGGQFFITLVPTPHLDGRYTAFGRVVEGMDAVMKLERGDIIERVQLLR